MLIYISIFLTTLLCVLVKRHYSKWQRLGISYDKPTIPFGSLLKVCRGERATGLVISDIYERFQDKLVGIYMFSKPAILLRSAELIQQIMNTDFASFHGRGMFVDEKNDPMSANLATLDGHKWRDLRAKLSPAFSSGQLKAMFGTIDKVGDNFVEYLSGQIQDGSVHTMDIKSLATTYALDIIGSVIFGLDIDSFKNPNNEFRVLSERIFHKGSFLQKLYMLMYFAYQPIMRLLSILGIKDPVTQGLREIVEKTIEYRENNNIIRKDLLQLMIQMKNQQNGEAESDSLSLDMIASNAFIFYMAGSETTSATIAFTIYELAMYPELLQRAQKEVDLNLEKHDLEPAGHLTYEALKDMPFLDMCIKETIRKYPSLPYLIRECNQDYLVPGTDFTIEKGTSVVIPLMGIQRDPLYFPNPMDYKPERFDKKNQEYNPTAFMPFGEGPRICIAQRMGLVNVKVALIKFLANFHIEPTPRKEVEFQFHTMPVMMPKDGIHVKISKRQ